MVSAQWMLGRNLFMSAAKNTVRIQRMCVAALLCAIAILVPMISPVKIPLGPMSFTLGSHVAIFIAMFLSLIHISMITASAVRADILAAQQKRNALFSRAWSLLPWA